MTDRAQGGPCTGTHRRPGRARLPRSAASQQAQAGPQAHRRFDQQAARRHRRRADDGRRRSTELRLRPGAPRPAARAGIAWSARVDLDRDRGRVRRGRQGLQRAPGHLLRVVARGRRRGRRAQAGRHQPLAPDRVRPAIERLVERVGRRGRGGAAMRSRSNASSSASSASSVDLGIGFEQRPEVAPLVPRPHRVALHDPIGVVAGRARRHQRQQHRLAEHQTVARPQVVAHPLGDRPAARAAAGSAGAARSATSSDESGSTMRSTEECEMSRSCHSATSCSPACRLDRDDAGQPADRLGGDRVALVRHRRRALLARLEPLLHLAHLGALQVAQLDGDQPRTSRRSTAHAQSNSAWRSRAITCVAGTGRQAEARRRRSASTAGSMLEYVPTAPD